jgi:hypothetical protein
MTVNPKNNKSYEIPFEKSPKFVFSSNFTLRDVDDSTEARILYTVFSDYYHEATLHNDYRETRKIYDDFGKTLHKSDYPEEDWNADINFIADCARFYLSVPAPHRINPPMENVRLRNLRTTMGDAFKNWADIYFFKDKNNEKENSDKIDCLTSKEEAYKDFINTTGLKGWSTIKFSKAIKAWAEYTDYVIALNPDHMQNSSGRIMKYIDGKTVEMLYVQTEEMKYF